MTNCPTSRKTCDGTRLCRRRPSHYAYRQRGYISECWPPGSTWTCRCWGRQFRGKEAWTTLKLFVSCTDSGGRRKPATRYLVHAGIGKQQSRVIFGDSWWRMDVNMFLLLHEKVHIHPPDGICWQLGIHFEWLLVTI